MASIEITDENPINVSLGEENTLVSSVSSPETMSVTSTDGWYEKKYEETDPIFEKSPASDITNEDIENWNNKSDFSGDYNDLENKPTIPDVPTNVSEFINDAGYLTEHQDISGKADIEDVPTKTSDLVNNSGFITSEADPVFSASASAGITSNDITNWNNKSSFSGSYTDLTNKPTIPDELSDLSDDTTHRLVTDTEKTTWSSKQDNLVSGTNIKTINNESILGSGNITIQGGGSGDGDMLKSVYDTNDNGIVDNAEKVNNHTVGTDVPSNAVFTDTVYDDTSIRQELNDKADSSDIPTKTSDLTNDSGFITDFGNSKTYYGTSDTGASTSAKVVTSSDFVLETGATIFVKFTNANTYNGTATLNVNGTGAKDIARVGATKTTRYYWTAGEVVGFVYDGTNFVMIEKGTATTTYYGLTKLSSSTTSTSEALSATPKAVKTAYDLANSKQDAITSSNKLDYSLIDNTPTIPTKTSDLTNDSGFLTQHQDISGKVDKETGKGLSTNDFTTTYKNNVDNNTSARHTHSNKSVLDGISSTDITNWNNKSTFSGSYNDLTNKPTIPSKTSDLTNDSGFLTSETDPTVPSWAKQNTKPSYQATEVSVDGSNLEEAGTSMVAIRSATETQEALRYISRAVKYNKEDIDTINNTSLPAKQNTLVSGTNIKTINSNSLLGSGDISFETIQDISESSVHIKNLSAGIYRICGETQGCDVYYNSTDYLSVPTMSSAYLIVTEYPDLYTTNNNWIFIGNGYPEFCYGYSWNNGGYCYNVTSKETQEAITGLLSNLTTTSKTNLVSAINELDSGKQDTLVSGANIKTINGNSILGSGDITVDTPVKSEINCYSATQVSTTSSGPGVSDLTVIPLTQNYKIGSKFTLSGNKIYIDSSVEKFEISAKVYFFSGNSISDLGRLNIIKNGNTYLASALGMVRNYTHVSLIPTVIENDGINYIELRFNNGGHTGVKQGIETKESTFIRVKEL